MGSGGPNAWLRFCTKRTLVRMAVMPSDSSASAIAEPARFHEAAHERLDDDGHAGVDAVACADDETLLMASTPCGQLGTASEREPRGRLVKPSRVLQVPATGGLPICQSTTTGKGHGKTTSADDDDKSATDSETKIWLTIIIS